MNPLALMWQAAKLWWKAWVGVLFLNMLWFLLLIPLVTAPAATVMFYTISQKIVQDEMWDLQDVWAAFRDNLWTSWRWALPNILIGAALLVNFYAYRGFDGPGWGALRIFWGIVVLAWLMTNLFYWPFWLSQEDKSLRTTYANCLRFFILHGGTAVALIVVLLIVFALSIRFVLPLVLGVTGWAVLLGSLAVDEALTINADEARGRHKQTYS